MNQNKIIILIALGVLLVYISFVNIVAWLPDLRYLQNATIINNTFVFTRTEIFQEVGASFSTKAGLRRDRYYGTIYSTHSKKTTSNYYLTTFSWGDKEIKFLKIPIRSERYNFKDSHIAISILYLIFFIILGLIRIFE